MTGKAAPQVAITTPTTHDPRLTDGEMPQVPQSDRAIAVPVSAVPASPAR